jgi:predicted DCC family thiol-disulfide oxidoreductase YuxK
VTADIVTRLAARPAYSWRGTVAPFDDTRPLLVFDGVCVLCSRSMRFIARHDASQSIQFTAAQSPLGQALFRHYALDVETFETVLLIEDGRAYGKRDALAGIARHLRWPWRAGVLYGWLPRRLANPAYDLLARNRYRMFGRADVCIRPDPSWASRVIK